MTSIPYQAQISQLPYGVVPTIAALRAIPVNTVSDNDSVQVLGSGATNDGYQGLFYFSGACLATDNGINVIEPSTAATGAWVRSEDNMFVTTNQTTNYSGIGETFVTLSGINITYTLPPSYSVFGQTITIKSLGTGVISISATGNDSIFPLAGTVTVATIGTSSSGAAYHLQAGRGVYYQV